MLGVTYTPHCAAIHPARLVGPGRGRTAGAGSRSTGDGHRDRPGRLRTPMGTVRARYAIRATEGYTPRLPGLERAIAPVYH